jgi:hypothetical protein
MNEQRLHFGKKRHIVTAFTLQKGVALFRAPLAGRVEQPLDLRPVRVHRREWRRTSAWH